MSGFFHLLKGIIFSFSQFFHNRRKPVENKKTEQGAGVPRKCWQVLASGDEGAQIDNKSPIN